MLGRQRKGQRKALSKDNTKGAAENEDARGGGWCLSCDESMGIVGGHRSAVRSGGKQQFQLAPSLCPAPCAHYELLPFIFLSWVVVIFKELLTCPSACLCECCTLGWVQVCCTLHTPTPCTLLPSQLPAHLRLVLPFFILPILLGELKHR